MIELRCELEKDYKIVEKLIEESFKNEEMSDKQEHNLVKKLRKSNEFVKELSIVAEIDDKIVGHILLTKINIKNDKDSVESLALAPVAVLPEFQNKGVGKVLINKAIEKSKELGFGSIVVLGHPGYYPKFGFERASKFGVKPPFEVPDEAFMVLELKEDSLKNVEGVVEYSKAFFE